MTQQAIADDARAVLLRARDGLTLHQCLYAAAKLAVADHLNGGWRSSYGRLLARNFGFVNTTGFRVLFCVGDCE